MGFRKWYERELLSSHAHLVLAVLSVIAMVASFEAFSGASLAEKLMDAMFVIVCAAIGLWSLRRYLYLMMRAEGVANQASCGDCGTYGRFKVVGQDRNPSETAGVLQQVRTPVDHLRLTVRGGLAAAGSASSSSASAA